MTNKEAIMKITGRVQILAENAGLQIATSQNDDQSVLFTSLVPGSVRLYETFEGQGAIAVDRADGKPIVPVMTRHYNDEDVDNTAKLVIEGLNGTILATHAHKHEPA
jgi:hypothetical protein